LGALTKAVIVTTVEQIDAAEDLERPVLPVV
jgi:hypothetical protein